LWYNCCYLLQLSLIIYTRRYNCLYSTMLEHGWINIFVPKAITLWGSSIDIKVVVHVEGRWGTKLYHVRIEEIRSQNLARLYLVKDWHFCFSSVITERSFKITCLSLSLSLSLSHLYILQVFLAKKPLKQPFYLIWMQDFRDTLSFFTFMDFLPLAFTSQ
jgi:hypothetical protein